MTLDQFLDSRLVGQTGYFIMAMVFVVTITKMMVSYQRKFATFKDLDNDQLRLDNANVRAELAAMKAETAACEQRYDSLHEQFIQHREDAYKRISALMREIDKLKAHVGHYPQEP